MANSTPNWRTGLSLPTPRVGRMFPAIEAAYSTPGRARRDVGRPSAERLYELNKGVAESRSVRLLAANNLASPDGNDTRPLFAQLMLDEAFSKSDPQFAQQALSAFRKFGFQLVILATVQNTTTTQLRRNSVDVATAS